MCILREVPITAQPEILPPESQGRTNRFDDAHLDLLAHLLDDFIRIPGTPIRFGLDGIVGFLPGIGDILGGLASSILILAAWSRGIPKITLARMVANVAIETAVGSLPVVGNLFDIGWKANRRNYALLTGAIANPGGSSKRSWLVVAGIVVVLILLTAAPIVLAGWLLLHLKAALR